MAEHKKRFRIEFTVDVNNEGIDGKEDWDWSDEDIENFALQELECMCPFPEDISFSDANPWHTGTPAEEGDYLVAFRMSDNSVEYGWCNWNNGAWDILCDYDTTDGSCAMIAWQRIEPCNWFDFLFSEGHCDNWREVR